MTTKTKGFPTYSIKGKQVEYKSFRFQVKSIDEDQGTITGYLSTFGNVDLGKDRVIQGAFKKTIADAYGRVKSGRQGLWPILWMHNPDDPIGIFIDAEEDDQGLLVTAQLDITVNKAGIPVNPQATKVFSGFKMGYSDELSIGYLAIQKAYDKQGVRDLKECALIEGSAVTMNFAMNPEALVPASGVKAMTDKKPTEKKDFNDAYRPRQIQDWKGKLWSMFCALAEAIDDAFEMGDTPLTDIQGELNGMDDSPGFVATLMGWVQEGIDLDYSNYMETEDQSDSYSSPAIYGYMSRQDRIAAKAGRTISQATQGALEQHQQEMKDLLTQHKAMVADSCKAMEDKVSDLTQLWDDEGQGPAYSDDTGKARTPPRREPPQALTRTKSTQQPSLNTAIEDMSLADLETLLGV